MPLTDWSDEQAGLIRLLEDILGGKETCSDLVDAFEEFAGMVWQYTARLIGDAGTNAVLTRSVRLAARDFPPLGRMRITERKVDLAGFRELTAQTGCEIHEVGEYLVGLTVRIFQTLSELSGDGITQPLLGHLVDKQFGATNG